MSETNEKLKAIRDATNQIIAGCLPSDFHDAINWGDIRCVNVLFYTDVHGDTGYQVVIEEAAPDSSTFQNYIAGKLGVAGFPNIEVRCEW